MIPLAKPSLTGNEAKYVNECINSGWISSGGSFVKRFEKAFGEYCGGIHASSCNNGTSALHLALKGLGIGPGDEVIVPTLTFAATPNTVLYVGAKPVFVDSDPITWNICPLAIKTKITKSTKAIVAVHLYGHPAKMREICSIALEHNLYVIEDAAEAHGAKCFGKPVGTLGDIACFSFFGNKILSTGEGGMITTANKSYFKTIEVLKNHGMSPNKKYYHPVLGYNYRLTNLQAAVGLAQLEQTNQFIAKRRKISQWYNEELGSIKGITLPPHQDWAEPVCWIYTILVNKPFHKSTNQIAKQLEQANVETRPIFQPMHKMPYISCEDTYPEAENIARTGISLPTHVSLRRQDIRLITKLIIE